jgi:GT2 family glycosyltransferase
VVDKIVSAPYVRRFGPAPGDLVGSLVICLYGKLEYVFLQCALFAGLPGIDRYELIYVCNSPELAEGLLTEARAAALIYGVSLIVVILAGNAGFAGANNVAAKAARSDRLLFVNPDVFPKDPAWALKHTAVLLSRPSSETRLFGAPLYYDDGSLMHAGMYFELDDGVAFEGSRLSTWRLLRVEHYGKGAPAESTALLRPRAVPAVTGAFISIERQWFEELGGFSTDYIFGHYEDADLCLRSHAAGATPWIHDLRLWHLEGKGSTRLPVHEGGSLVNRWLFSSRWGQLVTEDILGREPTHPAFRDES